MALRPLIFGFDRFVFVLTLILYTTQLLENKKRKYIKACEERPRQGEEKRKIETEVLKE